MKRIILTEDKFKKLMTETRFSNDMLFVSYLPSEYDPKKFKNIETDWMVLSVNKCRNGLWACPAGNERGWKEFCEREDFRHIGNNKFTFKLKPNAKIYEIDNEEDLKRISTAYMRDDTGRVRDTRKRIDFKGLISNGYDGIYATEDAVYNLRDYYNEDVYNLECWDIEQICIFNPNVIIPISNETVEINFPQEEDYWNDYNIENEMQ